MDPEEIKEKEEEEKIEALPFLGHRLLSPQGLK